VATISQKNLQQIGKVAVARVVQPEDEVTFVTGSGLVLRLRVADITVSGRSTRGVHLMDIGKDDSVASLARIRPDEAAEAEEPAAQPVNSPTLR